MGQEELAIGIGVGLLLLAFAASSATAKADEPKRTTFGTGEDEPIEEEEIRESEDDPFVERASTKRCDLDGRTYDEGEFFEPADVIESLRELGYGPHPGNENIESPQWRGSIRNAQREFRTLALKPYALAPDSFIDGVSGACFLRTLEKAMIRLRAGAWPQERLHGA